MVVKHHFALAGLMPGEPNWPITLPSFPGVASTTSCIIAKL
jgi:hypothetical protein